MAKKPNPKDATMRNVRASKKRDKKLEDRIALLEAHINALEYRINGISDLLMAHLANAERTQ